MREFLFAAIYLILFMFVVGCIVDPELPGFVYDVVVMELFCPNFNVLSQSC